MAVLSKPLSATDCSQKLSVPKEFHHLINGCGGGAELSVRDADTNIMYEFVLAIRRNRQHQKPVFQAAGWLDFVRSRRLQAGDLIFFSEDENSAGGFKIQARYTFNVESPSKRLTKTDCSSAFSVPHDFHALINGGRPCGQQLSVRDVHTNQMYNFVLEVHPERNYLPVFQAEAWLDFVKRRRLEAGDEIYFSTDETGGFTIRPLFDHLGRSDRSADRTTHVI